MVNTNASETNTRVEEEPDERYVLPDRIEVHHKVLTEVGGSTPKYSARHDESFGGAEYEHINSDDYEVRKIPLTSVTNEATGQRVTGDTARQLVEELTAWYGDFLENGFVTTAGGQDKWAFEVPAPDTEAFEDGGPFTVVYGN